MAPEVMPDLSGIGLRGVPDGWHESHLERRAADPDGIFGESYGPLTAPDRAAIEAHVGHPDKALGLLRNALSEGRGWEDEFHASLELMPLRGHPEFEAIIHPDG